MSLGKHIRREKGRIRRTVADVEEQKKQIEKLYAGEDRRFP